jgi:hypothetical protein
MATPFTSNQADALNQVRETVDFGFEVAPTALSLASVVADAVNKIDAGLAASRLRSWTIPLGAEPSISSEPVSARFSTSPGGQDWRVRIDSPLMRNGSAALAPLVDTSGVVWPYTPTVTLSHSANYSQIATVHNNFPFYAYNSSQVDDINISGEFSVQSAEEARYWLASVHFFRTVTKMFFGQGENVGNPPPICTLNGYGDFVFKDVSVIVKNFSVEMPKDVDYIATETSFNTGSNQRGTLSYVPTLSTLSVTVSPVYSREKIKSFNLKSFANGQILLSGDGRGFI